MDKLKKYQTAIVDFLATYEAKMVANPVSGIKESVSVDLERGHFQLFATGWQKSNYIFAPILHFDIIDGKIWIQQNNTELFVADALIELGVLREDIVLGFKHPASRIHTGFAVA